MSPDPSPDPGIARLEGILAGLGSCLVAYSGGVDSTFLLAVARRALGERVAAVTVRTLLHEGEEIRDAVRRAERIGVPHETLEVDLAAHPEVLSNPPDRCYRCKSLIFTRLLGRAGELGLAAVADATQADDLGERRPGLRALRELGVRSPLAEAGLSKAAVRELSRRLGIEGANRPSNPCLATRIPFGSALSEERLRRVAGAERVLRERGFEVARVRDHGDTARIEVRGRDIGRAAAGLERKTILDALRALGYRYVSLDLEGYRSGSMDEALEP